MATAAVHRAARQMASRGLAARVTPCFTTHHHSAAARSIATGKRSYDVIVIGAGVIGSACALELRRKGFTTLNVDTNPSPGYGSTSSSSAIVRHFYSVEESCRLAWEGYHCWKAWPDHLKAPAGSELCELHEIGCMALDVPASPAAQTYLSRVKASMHACGIPVEVWSEEELLQCMPYLSTTSYYPPRRVEDDRFGDENGGRIAGALFCAQAGYINDPQLAARNLAEAALRSGGEFCWRAEVTGVLYDSSGTRVQGLAFSDGSKVEAPIVVNAAGPHSQMVHDMAFRGSKVTDDSRIRSRPLKVEVAYVPEPPGANADATMPVVADLDAGIYFRPQQGGQLVVGSVEPECDELEFLDTPEDMSPSLSEEWTNYVYRAALRMPSLQVPNSAAGLVALYDTTEDWVPIYDRTALGGFYAMRGTSGNQFKNAPVAGRICAELIEGCENGHDHDSRPFTLPLLHTGARLNLGTFSRLRQKTGTSGTVLG